jgi:two-component system response regulator PilR (NtrC family)
MRRILVIDDEKSMRELLVHLLKRAGYRVIAAESGEKGVELFGKDAYDLVISDVSMPGMSGLEVLRKVRETSPDTPVVLITAHGTKETAIEAVKLGAFDYFEKPFNVEEVLTRVGNAVAQKQLVAENVYLRRELKGKFSLVGSGSRMKTIYELIQRVADTSSTIMISGESGTGKEQIARAIHYNSVRRDRQFVSINCGALPGRLAEAAVRPHARVLHGGDSDEARGCSRSDGGRIFLDEVGDFGAMQVKLLRVLQEKRIRRVGGTEEIEVDVRVLTATNQDLDELVREKRFREDLYYRIAVIPVRLPALRDRREDIPELAHHFLHKYREIIGKKSIKSIAQEAMDVLLSYDWPGNIRELENVIERAVALEVGEEIGLESLPFDVRTPGGRRAAVREESLENGIDLERHLEERRVAFMREALRKTAGVQSHAARLLGMSFRSFRYFAKKYDLGGRAVRRGKRRPRWARASIVSVPSQQRATMDSGEASENVGPRSNEPGRGSRRRGVRRGGLRGLVCLRRAVLLPRSVAEPWASVRRGARHAEGGRASLVESLVRRRTALRRQSEYSPDASVRARGPPPAGRHRPADLDPDRLAARARLPDAAPALARAILVGGRHGRDRLRTVGIRPVDRHASQHPRRRLVDPGRSVLPAPGAGPPGLDAGGGGGMRLRARSVRSGLGARSRRLRLSSLTSAHHGMVRRRAGGAVPARGRGAALALGLDSASPHARSCP